MALPAAITAAGARVRLWSVAAKKEIAVLKGHTMPVRAVAFSPDGNTLASACGDTIVRLWRAVSFATTDPPESIRRPQPFR